VDVLRREPLLEDLDRDVRVERLERPLGRVGLGLAEAVGRVDDLALQIRLVDRVVVDDAERADAGRGQIERGRRPEPTRADQEYARLEEPELPLLADLRDEEVAAVAAALVRVEGLRDLVGEAVPLPVGEAAGQRRHILVPALFEGFPREGRAIPGGRVHEDLALLVGDDALDPRLEVAARNVDGAGKVALVPLFALAHVDDGEGVLGEQLLRLRGIDFVDLGLGPLQELAIGRHNFTKYSNLIRAATAARATFGGCLRAPESG